MAFLDDVNITKNAKIFRCRFWRFKTMLTSQKKRKYFEAVFGVYDDVNITKIAKIFRGRF